eukprot:TRINITY_DN21151_c0_g1_i2.p1 TRINITY_DN21151_c0_g1~~TRINITY_DN21151_c0_g1_i2.p1  ORF type:complete len:351 (+),score=45.40 TRINITY_DN21151_c0_g1_i2:77-1129(+)
MPPPGPPPVPWVKPLRVLLILTVLSGGGATAFYFAVQVLRDTASDELRAGRVRSFNEAVLNWSAPGGPLDACRALGTLNVSFPVSAAAPGGDTHPIASVAAKAVNGGDGLRDDGDAVLSWERLRYEARPLSFVSGAPLSPWAQVATGVAFTTAGGSGGGPLSTDPVNIAWAETYPTSNWKQCQYGHGGSLHGGSLCLVFRTAVQLCFRIATGADNASWAAADPSAPGCRSPLYNPLEGSRKEPVPRYDGFPAAVSLQGTRVVIRHAADPFLAAWRLTGGSLSFGRTKQERIQLGAALAIFAVIMFVTALFFLGVAVWQAWPAIRAMLLSYPLPDDDCDTCTPTSSSSLLR